jgi:hypothetical protein
VARARTGLGELWLARKDPNRAATEIDLALASLQALVDKDRSDKDLRRELAAAENARGLTWKMLGQPARATVAWSHSVDLLGPLVRDSSDWTVLDPWVRALVYLGRHEEARLGQEKLTSIGYREPGYLREVAGARRDAP